VFKMMVFPDREAWTPCHFGVNIEIQEYCDQINLWDWLVDSGATIVREFHPETSLRMDANSGALPATHRWSSSPAAPEGVWDDILTREDFESFRDRVRRHPAGDTIQWDLYAFERPVAWFGVPDEIIGKVTQCKVQPLVSMAYHAKMFPRPLVKDMAFSGVPTDDQIDWSAAAGAYDYYFAVMYHFASHFNTRYFLMHNEPECDIQCWYLPEDMERIANSPGFHGDDEGKRRVLGVLSTQWSVLARVARMALEDAEEALGSREGRLFLSGPTNGAWAQFWDKGGIYLDSLDYHHYHPDPAAFVTTYRCVAAQASTLGKRTSMSEYGLAPRGRPMSDILVDHNRSLQLAGLMMKVLAPGGPTDPACEYMIFYGLGVPALLRNYYSLVLPDMNLIRWENMESKYADADWADEWTPTVEERQLRFATPAYHMFRMLARCVPGGKVQEHGYPVLRTGIECLIDDWHDRTYGQLDTVTVDAGDRVFVNLLNPSRASLKVFVEVGSLRDRFNTAVLRRTGPSDCDAVIAETPLTCDRMPITLAERSLSQIILTPLALDQIQSVRLEEHTSTPGTADHLEVFQTTRFRALAEIGNKEVDITGLNAIWESSRPPVVAVHQGGLVQRLRRGEQNVTVCARTPNGAKSAPVTIG